MMKRVQKPLVMLKRQARVYLILFTIPLLLVVACSTAESTPAKEGETALSLSSIAFTEGNTIPVKYTCDGQNISPPLEWSDPPQQTQAFTLIVDDPDAPIGTFAHWVIFNIPADSRKLTEGIPAQAQLPSGAQQGENDFGEIGYGGPCPPTGRAHRYQFALYALDQPLDLEAGISRGQLLNAMQSHVLAQGYLSGVYQR
jgi:Raf kinase inhibitor-like YbhB/YbcL family protein